MSSTSPSISQTWVIVGASRGIGFEFVRQLRALNHKVVATVRNSAQVKAAEFFDVSEEKDCLALLQCDVTDEQSIVNFADAVGKIPWLRNIDVVVLNAGVLKYPTRATEGTFTAFQYHLNTNAIGPLITAQQLLKLSPTIPISKLAFISSDSGSTTNFLAHEDGFAAYSTSKAALNQGLRHLAAELQRKQVKTTVLAIHPGEVSTDMANIDIDWTVEGRITPGESVSGMLGVIEKEGNDGVGSGKATFWTWEGVEYPW